MTRLALGLASLVFSLAACGEGGQDVADAPTGGTPREVITDNRSLVPGMFAEGTLTGGPGDYAVIKLSAPIAQIDWNIHGHANNQTQTVYEELDVMAVEYTFQPTSATDWYLLVRNSSNGNLGVDIRVELFGDMTWAWL
jgi:hypothetical protein